MGRPGRKASSAAKRRQTTRAGQGRTERAGGTVQLIRMKTRLTGRADLPMDPLGILFGHGRIDRALYDAGLRLERAHAACFGAGAAAERDIYGLQMTMASTGGRRARPSLAESEDTTRREQRTEREYDRLLAALAERSIAAVQATLGIATRPYAGAWLVAALVDRTPWTARHDAQLALIKDGLAAIERLGSREL